MKLGMVRAGLGKPYPAVTQPLSRACWDQQRGQNSGGWEPPQLLRVLQS